jgi:hypothetical protein
MRNMEWVVTIGLAAIFCAVLFGSLLIFVAVKRISDGLGAVNTTLKAGVITEVVLGGPSQGREA